ncbi:MAG: ankyrin repeat domain-containing protein [Puniceicoccales bacterium]|jgi:ankyrin repeat protein|nr:ankyrin repeat domain-containing protein [Puniceicoccales bacterium]
MTISKINKLTMFCLALHSVATLPMSGKQQIPPQGQQIPNIPVRELTEEKKVIKESSKILMNSGISRENAETFIALMLRLSQLSQETTKDYNAWFKAIEKGDLNKVRKIYEQYSNIDVNRPDPTTKRTPIFTTVYRSDILLTEFLCQIPTIDLNIQDAEGWTVWHWATITRKLQLLKSMRQVIASTGNINWSKMLNTVDNTGHTPLGYAMKYDYPEIVQWLKDSGATY